MKTADKDSFLPYQSAEILAQIQDHATVGEMWDASVREYADEVAVIFAGERHTYAQTAEDVARYRTLLRDAGLTAGDRVLLFCPNGYLFVKAFLAAVTLGITPAILPVQLDEGSVYGCAMKFSARAILADPALADKTAIAKSKGIPVLSVADTSDRPTPACDTLTEQSPCVIMFTGGTTGKSKGALLSHGAVMQGTVNGCYGYDDVFRQRYLLVLPLSHVFGLIRNLMTALYTGSTLYICQNNKDMFRDIAVFRPTILVMVPALAEMALNLSRQFGRNMLGEDLRYIICGAAPVAPYLVEEYGKMGIGLCPGYGLTESANLVSGNPDFRHRPDSVGLMYPNQEYRVVDGELWLRGRNMMTGYVGDDEENALAYTDGWFRTGDLVRFDEDGFLYITGRIKEMLLLPNGENVSPAEAEAKFNALPTVQDSQVFEDTDEGGHPILALEVVPRLAELKKAAGDGDGRAFLLAQLNEVNASLLPSHRVSRITVRDTDFARTPSMKIVRYKKCH